MVWNGILYCVTPGSSLLLTVISFFVQFVSKGLVPMQFVEVLIINLLSICLKLGGETQYWLSKNILNVNFHCGSKLHYQAYNAAIGNAIILINCGSRSTIYIRSCVVLSYIFTCQLNIYSVRGVKNNIQKILKRYSAKYSNYFPIRKQFVRFNPAGRQMHVICFNIK